MLRFTGTGWSIQFFQQNRQIELNMDSGLKALKKVTLGFGNAISASNKIPFAARFSSDMRSSVVMK